MIRYNGNPVELNHFPDGTLLMKETVTETEEAVIRWNFENNEEMVALYFLAKHLRAKGVKRMVLELPYIPNARQDRVKKSEDVFTLKYFAEFVNSLGFAEVTVLDPHSYVSEALFDNLRIRTPKDYVEQVIERLGGTENLLLFFPDEGAMKRYSAMFDLPYVFGIKKRDWTTGDILGLDVAGRTELIAGSRVLIIDDICSKGGTFFHSAKALKKLGAGDVSLYISHCESSIFEGELLTTDWITQVYTTDSIFTGSHEKITVLKG
ncbi:MAG: ribose-phosphate pyrophosphokinase [Lachnospiraceae bacterium]|nr:ribose-phosphate pyrophosphokinase [Lachnospiraceae bacterium]